MAGSGEKHTLPLARPLPGGRRLGRLILRLPDGYQTGIYLHPSGGQARAAPVLYVHGIQSHPGWFAGSAAYLAGCGHDVFQVTRRGSGLNERDRGHARSAAQLLDDVEVACRFVLRQTGAERLHLLGVSWGGKLLACYALEAQDRIDIASLSLVAPGIVPVVDVSVRTKIAIALALIPAPRKQFEIPLSDVELFTDNEPMREYLRADRFRLRRATSRFLYSSRRLDRILRSAPVGALRVPTRVILARRDRIIDNRATRAVLERLTAGGAVVEEFDAAHTLEFAPAPRRFYEALGRATGC